MVRFLNLKNQICEGQNDFAFFDTVICEILSFNGNQVFSSLLEFEELYKEEHRVIYKLSRFTDLIPDDYFVDNL